jgi:histidinol-phosphate aminotransferase
VVPREDLLRIVAAAPDTAVLVDEAYFEFGGETLLPAMSRHDNLFVARTFSKAYGMAGLRLGVLTGAAEQIECMRRFCSPFNVNAVALACLEEALADQETVSSYIAQIKEGRERLEELCRELGLTLWPSRTNFVLIRVGASCKALVERMALRGVSVRDVSGNPGCKGCVRITVGTREQMDTVLRVMRESAAECLP